MKDLQELSEVIKIRTFLQKYTDIGINSGVRHRLNGKGTRKEDKQVTLRDHEAEQIDAGLGQLISDIESVRETLKPIK